ncbi:MAG: glutamate racemase [bacterium]|nr:glutamate racemase [bacterium]
MVKVGVFDSGVGGLSVANAIKKTLPDLEILVREDKDNLPYGTKSPDQLLALVTPILEDMVHNGCSIIVVACNTVTTTIIGKLREIIEVPLIGMEPMIKPAAELTKTNVIAVFATPTTLASDRYNWLKSQYCEKAAVIEPDCSSWSRMIEHSQVDESQIMTNTLTAITANADVIVLGCTHYHWIEKLIKQIADGKATILQPEVPVIDQLKKVLQQIG